MPALLLVGVLLFLAATNPVHAHQCGCGNRWTHSGIMRGNKLAHTCSKCGATQWEISE